MNEQISMRESIETGAPDIKYNRGDIRMGREEDPGAVTDPSGRVYGVSGLRVCDASIMPMVPCANTNISTIMIGEKISASILAE